MTRRSRLETAFTLSGPGVDRSYPDAGPALSAAITYACRPGEEATFYVRDAAGDIYGRTERDSSGNVSVWRLGKSK